MEIGNTEKAGDGPGRPEPLRHPLSRPFVYRFGFACARWVPAPLLYRAADAVGEISHLACRAPAANVLGNLRRAFPSAPGPELERLSRRIFRNFARYLVDYARFRSVPTEALDRAVPVLEGEENLRAAFAIDRGIIAVTGHVGNWELGGVFFGRHGMAINVVTLPEGRARIDEIRAVYRRRNNINTIVLDGSPFAMVEMVAALRRREIVAMLVDRWGDGDGVAAEFFGAEHRFPRGPFALSRATGAPIVPAFVVRDGRSYRGIVDPPFVAAGEDDAPYARSVSRSLERVVGRCPDQWYNFVPIGPSMPDPGKENR